MEVSISIDVGTSYSSVCMLKGESGEEGKIVPVEIGTSQSMYGSKYSLPSAVYLSGDELLLGQAAMNSRFQNPQNFKAEFKRHLGEDVPMLLGGRSYMPEDFYTAIFEHMKHRVDELTGGEQIKKVYIMYPASYGTKKQKKILSAAQAAGLFGAELVDEPTSAAMYYDAQGLLGENQNLLVYDFGGGTFDAALIRGEDGVFRILAQPMGLPQCGGTDIDRMLYADILKVTEQSKPDLIARIRQNDLATQRFESQISELAVKAKEHLSAAENFSDGVAVGLADYIPYTLSRDRYEQMIMPLVEKTIELCESLLVKAGLKKEELSAVLLVGGTSRVPLVRAKVREFAGDGRVLEADDLDLAVSAGALEKAKQKSGPDSKVLEELTGMGRRYLYGEGVGLDAARAVILLKQAADYEHAPAQMLLASCFEEGKGTEQDLKKALHLYERAAKHGEIRAQCRLGLLYTMGTALTKADPEKAAYWIRQAAGQGDANALYEIAREYEEDASCTEALQTAAHLYTQAAALDSADACLRAGIFYLQGRAVERSPETALSYFLKAAGQGDCEAAVSAARLYESGDGIPRDLLQARFWYNMAADQGSAAAQKKMAEFCAQGTGGTRDETMASVWYLKAAQQGDAEAAFRRAERCSKGIGTAVDQQEALKWYEKAAEQGYPQAKQRQKALENLLEQLEKAIRRKEEEEKQRKDSESDGRKNPGGGSPKHPETPEERNERIGQLVWEFTKNCTDPVVTKGRIIPVSEVNSRLRKRLRLELDEQIYIWQDATDNARAAGSGKYGYAVTSRGIRCVNKDDSLHVTTWEVFLRGRISRKRAVFKSGLETYLEADGFAKRTIFVDGINPLSVKEMNSTDSALVKNRFAYMREHYFTDLQKYLHQHMS